MLGVLAKVAVRLRSSSLSGRTHTSMVTLVSRITMESAVPIRSFHEQVLGASQRTIRADSWRGESEREEFFTRCQTLLITISDPGNMSVSG